MRLKTPRANAVNRVACCMTFSLLASAANAELPQLPALSQEVIDEAIATEPFACFRKPTGHHGIRGNGSANIALALAAWQGNTSADATLLERIRFSLQGDKTIFAIGGYWTQHERHITGMFTLAKLTPRIWNQLSADERGKIDLLMKAATVASAYVTSDVNHVNKAKPTGLDGDTNLHRGWNPNYREGLVGMMILAPIYFGGGEAVHGILDTYDHDAFVAQLHAAGLTNAAVTFDWKKNHPESNAPDGAMIAAGIKNYRYKEIDSLADPMDLYYRLTVNTYGAKVNAGLNAGKGIDGGGVLQSGIENLPNVGEDGMLKEFDSFDANGKRSSADYSLGGYRPNLTNHIVLLAGGGWKPGPQADECLRRMNVGITDLYYKLEHGYRDYSKGKPAGRITPVPKNDFAKPLWEQVVKPYHDTLKVGASP